MLTALTNSVIFTGSEKLSGKTLIIEDDKIKAIADPATIPADIPTIDCNGDYIAPGLIDLQVAGGGGYLFSADPSVRALQAMTESIVKSGTTGFLIAISTDSDETYHKAIQVVRDNPHPALLGLHLEGPFISMVKAGAHPKQYIRAPQKKEIMEFLSEACGTIKMVTMAPEVCDPDIIRLLNENGVTVAAGHSNATYKEAVRSFENGVRSVTHLFNAMSPLHHRGPGLPGAAFMNDSVSASIIADGIHVDYHIVALSKKIMRERLFLITDAVEESNHGAYIHVRQKDRFTLPNGTLSGSCLTMMKAVKNCIENVSIPIDESLRMASAYQAKLMNLSDKGRIAPGYSADLVIFNKEFEIRGVYIKGMLKH